MVNHLVIVICLIDTEHGLINSLLGEGAKNDNMVCVIVDIIILIIIDVPDLPYPFNIILFGSDIGYICFKLWNHGDGAKLYHISKTVIVLLLGL